MTEKGTHSDWVKVGGKILSGPGVCSYESGRIDVFAQGPENALIHIWLNNGVWSDWDNLGGFVIGAPSPIIWIDGKVIEINVYTRGKDNRLNTIV